MHRQLLDDVNHVFCHKHRDYDESPSFASLVFTHSQQGQINTVIMTPARPLMRHYQLPVNGVALDTSVFGPTDRDEIMPGSAAEQTTSSATKSNHQSAIAELAMPSPSTKTMSRAHGEPWTRSSLLASGWDSLDDEPGHAWTSQTVAIPSPGRPSEGHVALIDITVVSTDSDGGKVHDNKKKRAKAKSLTTRKRSGKKKTGQKKQTKKVSSHDSDDWEEPFPLGTASPPKPAILTRARSLAESVASRSTRRRYALRRQSVRDSAPIRSEAKVRRRGGEKESSSTGTTEGSDACVHGSEDKEPKSEQERRDARPEARPAVSTKAKRKAVSSASTSAVAASDSQASVSGNDWSEEGVRLTRARKKSRIGHSLASTTLEGEEDCLVADALKSTARVSSSPPRKPCNVVRTRRLVIAQETILESEGRSFVEQSVLCQKAMLREMPQCRACSVRKAGDSCRFQHLRAFPIEVQANRHYLAHDAETAFIFRQSARAVRELPVSPTHDDLNRPMDDSAKKELMRTCALALLPILEKALVHARQSHTHFRHPELQIRAMCDFCNTGLFASSYLCRRCGQEYCLSCKQSMPATNNDPKKARANQLWTCVGRNAVHSTDDLIPFSRHSVEELEDETHAMRTVLTSVGRPVSSITHQVDVLVEDSPSLAQVLDLERPFLDADTVGVADRDRCVDATASSDTGSLFGNARSFTQRICSSAASQSEEVPTLPLASFEKGTMSEADFLSVWQRGEPLIVNKVHTNVDWDPATFKDRYGDLDCEIVRCDAEPPAMSNNQRREKQNTDPSYFHRWIKTIKVSRFFDTFGASTEKREELLGKGIWKLKVRVVTNEK